MIIRKTRNVSLTPELDAFVDSTVASGRYRSASEVKRVAHRLLPQQVYRAQRQPKPMTHAAPADR